MRCFYATLALVLIAAPAFPQEGEARARAIMAMAYVSPSNPKCNCGCTETGICTCGLNCPDILSRDKAREKTKVPQRLVDIKDDGSIEWRNYDEGIAEAKQKNLPSLVYMRSKDCVWCDLLEKEMREDKELISCVNQGYVPIQVYGDANPALVQAFSVQGYPTLTILNPDRTVRMSRRGFVKAGLLRSILRPFSRTSSTFTVPLDQSYLAFPQESYGMPLGSPQNIWGNPSYSQPFLSYPRASYGYPSYSGGRGFFGRSSGGSWSGGS